MISNRCIKLDDIELTKCLLVINNHGKVLENNLLEKNYQII